MRTISICCVVLLLFILPQISQSQTEWLKNTTMTYLLDPSVVYDSTAGLYRMWYANYGVGGVGYGVSSDGITWSMADTLVMKGGEPGSFDAYIHSTNVVRHHNVYTMLYTCSRAQDTLKIGMATSLDGRHWTKAQGGPVLSPVTSGSGWESRHVAAGDLISMGDTLYMWYGGGDGTHMSTGLARSVDGTVWMREPSNPVVKPGRTPGFDDLEASVVGVTKKGGTYYMVYRGINLASQQSYLLATSLNGVKWWQYPSGPVINTGYPLGGGCLMWNNGLFRLWYCGSSWGWTLTSAVSEAVILSAPDARGGMPEEFVLHQNYPNPFNPSTEIRVDVPATGRLFVAVYDVLGRLVEVLADEVHNPGTATYTWHAAAQASGMYICRTSFNGKTSVTKMMLVR